jgi:hypothetical protein
LNIEKAVKGMADDTKRKRGGQKGNQNARKRNFYCKTLSAQELNDFTEASNLDGIDNEIVAVRVQIKWLMDNDPGNMKMIWRGMNALGRLLKLKNSMGKNNKNSMEEAVEKLLRGVPLPPRVERRG